MGNPGCRWRGSDDARGPAAADRGARGEFVHAVDDVQYGLGEGPCLLPDQPGGHGPGAGGRLVEALLRRRASGTGSRSTATRGHRLRPDAPSAWVTIPSVIRAGWWWGADRHYAGEFFQAEITQALFR
jgi:hypothetical protein